MKETYLSHLVEWQVGKLIHCTAMLIYLFLPVDSKLLEGKDYISDIFFLQSETFSLLQISSTANNIYF